MTKLWKVISIAVVAICAGAAGYVMQQQKRAETSQSKAVLQLLALTLPDPAGNMQPLTKWRGKILVVNFWATWCEPCREEIPVLVRLREKYAGKSVEMVGIAVDSASKVRQYAKDMKITYPLLVGGLESIELARSFGDVAGGLPFTVVLDAKSGIALSHLGLIKEQELDQKLAALAR